jgi:hypothetical protein
MATNALSKLASIALSAIASLITAPGYAVTWKRFTKYPTRQRLANVNVSAYTLARLRAGATLAEVRSELDWLENQ